MERPRSGTSAATAPAPAAAAQPQNPSQRLSQTRLSPACASASADGNEDDEDDDMSGERPHWSRFIQNESYVPPPTPYSPRAATDEDPLVEQERRCRDKLQALRAARDRFRFFPSADARRTDPARTAAQPLRFSTEMVFSAAEAAWERDERREEPSDAPAHAQPGVDALGGLELLLFEFFTSGELLVAGQACRRWRRLARLDLLWEPRLVTPAERYPMRELLGLDKHVPAVQVFMIFRRLRLAQSPVVEEAAASAGGNGGWSLPRRVDERRRALMALLQTRGNDRNEQLQRLLEMELRVRNQGGDAAPVVAVPAVAVPVVAAPATSEAGAIQQQQPQPQTLQAAMDSAGQDASAMISSLIDMDGQDVLDFEPTASVHLVTAHRTGVAALGIDPASSTEAPVAAAPERGIQNRVAGLLAATNNRNVDARNRTQLNARHVGGTASTEEEDVFSVVDGRDRVNLASWLGTKKTVSEFSLRSFIRQMLLAVRALKAARVEHIDISLANIVVVLGGECPSESFLGLHEDTEEKAETTEAMEGVLSSMPTSPLFQLFYNRRHLRPASSNSAEPAFDFAAPRPLAVDADLDREVLQDVDMLEPRGEEVAPVDAAAAALAAAAAVLPHGLGAGLPGGARGGLGLLHRTTASFSMIQSVLNCAIAVWAHGRFADSNTIALLTLLLRHPTEFPRGLRSFLEYAKFLLMTNAMSVDRLLQHEFVVSGAESASQSSNIVRYTDWEAGSFRDVGEYRARVLAWYRSSTNVGMVDVSSSKAPVSVLADELTPRTALGARFFAQALEETGLANERFVSVVAPPDVSSSWIRALALTQAATLQRLDLSRVHVPPSVILKEITKLPRISHLRLPPQFLRDENLEHLIAALEYSALLPALRATDVAVRNAMDRLERSYTMQLDMVTFLLEKPAGR